MGQTLRAVYRDGVLCLLDAVRLEEGQQLTLTILDPAAPVEDLAGYFSPEEWKQAEHDDISLLEVRRALSTISGSLSEAVIGLRHER